MHPVPYRQHSPDAPARPPIQPLRSFTWGAVGALGLVLVLMGLEIVASFTWLTSAESDPESDAGRRADLLFTVSTYGEAVAVTIAAVAFIAWSFRARDNVESFDRWVQNWRRPWLAFAWITPVVGLFAPRKIVIDLWIGSHPEDREARQAESTPMINAWWACFLLYGYLTSPLALGGELTGRAVTGLVNGTVGLVGVVLAILIVLGIDRGLRDQAARAGFDLG